MRFIIMAFHGASNVLACRWSHLVQVAKVFSKKKKMKKTMSLFGAIFARIQDSNQWLLDVNLILAKASPIQLFFLLVMTPQTLFLNSITTSNRSIPIKTSSQSCVRNLSITSLRISLATCNSSFFDHRCLKQWTVFKTVSWSRDCSLRRLLTIDDCVSPWY